MRTITGRMNALADGTRLRILCALREGELCVCQVVALLKLAPSTVSKHLSILRSAGLAESRKDGRWMVYRAARPRGAAANRMLAALVEDLDRTSLIRRDRKRLKAICAKPMDIVCRIVFPKPSRQRHTP